MSFTYSYLTQMKLSTNFSVNELILKIPHLIVYR